MKIRTGLILAIAASLFTANSQAMVIKLETKLDGAQEVTPVRTEATGIAKFKYNIKRGLVDFTLKVRGISLKDITFPKGTGLAFGAAGPVHLHNGVAGTNGDIVLAFADRKFYSRTKNGFTLRAKKLVAPAELAKLLNIGSVYINVHTLSNGGGEIRGQLSNGVAAVAEPASMALLGLGSLGLMLRRRKAIQA